MIRCPRCETALRAGSQRALSYWVCPGCHGRAIKLRSLQKIASHEWVESLWADSLDRRREASGPACPSCRERTREVASSSRAGAFVVDVCGKCHLAWFDSGEYVRIPARAAGEEREVAFVGLPPRRRPHADEEEPETALILDFQPDPDAALASVFRLPDVTGAPELRRFPVVTWALLGLLALLTDVVVNRWEGGIATLGFVPASAFRSLGVTWLTGALVHGDWIHYASNAYVLFLLGQNVEDHLGRKRFLELLFWGAIMGHVAVWLATPRSPLPHIGASGALFAVMAYFWLLYPRARVTYFLHVFARLQAPVGLVFPLLMLLQMAGVSEQIAEVSSVSYLSHVGGAAAAVLYRVFGVGEK